MATVIDDGVSGYVNTDVATLIACMQELQANPSHAAMLGDAARRYARERFHIGRFARDWDRTFRFVTQF
jgi:glycosyltransferase involved in cell wall biosynthesis